MARPVVIFEDELADHPFSLILTRPVFDLVCGCMSLGEKIERHLRAAGEKGSQVWWAVKDGEPDIRFHLRDYLAPGRDGDVSTYRERFSEGNGLTLVNGRLVFSADVLGQIDPEWTGRYVCGERTAVANVPPDFADQLEEYIGKPIDQSIFSGLPVRELKADLITYPWDLIKLNGTEIAGDFDLLGGAGFKTEPGSMVYLVGRENIRIGENVRIAPGVAIDAARGPVSIDDNVTIMANASLEGPLHIGSRSTVKMGAKVYGQTTIGPVCKVGGEIAESIIHGYSNKQHEGFVGHSYIGEWVNLGAGTETSDMKNNYSTVRVRISGETVDSGELFVGLFMGDHSKSGIGTVFNTGTLVGVCCNVFGADYPPKHIPSFIWGGAAGFAEHDLDKAIETAGRAMARRERVLGGAGEAILRKAFELTAAERRDFLE
jgi:UDP-N-acetylglucosamine diphosphorylase/glucosamine-1-phosphate N-acetyltransferase